jgi:hypothetical protein
MLVICSSGCVAGENTSIITPPPQITPPPGGGGPPSTLLTIEAITSTDPTPNVKFNVTDQIISSDSYSITINDFATSSVIRVVDPYPSGAPIFLPAGSYTAQMRSSTTSLLSNVVFFSL